MDLHLLDNGDGSTPEVGVPVSSSVFELVDGTRVRILEGAYLDPINRDTESWDREGLLALAEGLRQRTLRRLRSLES